MSNTSTLATRVMFGRLGSSGAKLFFTLAIGVNTPEGPVYGLIIRDLVLRESTNGKGDYVGFPSKPRTKKTAGGGATPITYTGEVKDGKPVYDSIVDLYFEGKDTDRKPTEFAWDVRKQVIEQAVEAYNKLAHGESGRGTAQAAAPAPSEFQRTTGAASAPRKTALFADSQDEVPF